MNKNKITNNSLLKIEGLKISFNTTKGLFPAVKDVSLEINRNTITGIVGESGCGKSITSLSIMGLLPENAQFEGKMNFLGKDISYTGDSFPDKSLMRKIRGKEISMIFQEPMTSLNPLWKVGKQIEENLALHTDMNRKERFENVLKIMKDVGLGNGEELYHKYPHELSGGMRQRIVIAIAIACRPKLIIADEPTTALDVTIQAQILELLKEIKSRSGSSIIFISHDLGVINEICDDVCVMYSGYIVEKSGVRELFDNPNHPYTMGLIKSIPDSTSKGKTLYNIPGKVPSIYEKIDGCPFATRCEFAVEKCREKLPEFRKISDTHHSRCIRAGEIEWNRL